MDVCPFFWIKNEENRAIPSVPFVVLFRQYRMSWMWYLILCYFDGYPCWSMIECMICSLYWIWIDPFHSHFIAISENRFQSYFSILVFFLHHKVEFTSSHETLHYRIECLDVWPEQTNLVGLPIGNGPLLVFQHWDRYFVNFSSLATSLSSVLFFFTLWAYHWE